MIMRLTILTFLLFTSALCSAQAKKEEARENLKKLKDGALLIRLQTSQMKIDALKKRGLVEDAKKAEQKQYDENKEIILSFSQIFDFCPVYFFYSDKSEDIMENRIEGTIFDANQNLVAGTELPNFFLVGEFGNTQKLSLHGLVLMDQFMVPLEYPFPFYQRQFVFFSLFELSKAEMAERYDNRLKVLYAKWFGETPKVVPMDSNPTAPAN